VVNTCSGGSEQRTATRILAAWLIAVDSNFRCRQLLPGSIFRGPRSEEKEFHAKFQVADIVSVSNTQAEFSSGHGCHSCGNKQNEGMQVGSAGALRWKKVEKRHF
jgi:hypothetical protein